MYQPLNSNTTENDIFERPFAKPPIGAKLSPLAQAFNSIRDVRYEHEGWWAKDNKAADEDPLAHISTGLPSNLKELAKDLDPTTLSRIMTATVVVVKGLKLAKELGSGLYQRFRSAKDKTFFPDYDSLSGYSPLGDITNTKYKIPEPKVNSYTDSEFKILRELVEYFITAQAPEDIDFNSPAIVDDETAKMLLTLGSLGIDNDQLARLKFFPKDSLEQIVAILKKHDENVKSDKSMFQPFMDDADSQP